MPVSAALTTDEQTALTGASIITRYLSPIPDSVVASARINQVTFQYPLASLTVDGTSLDWVSVAAGMTVYIGSISGAHDKGIYRVRKAGNSTTLFLAETSSSDPGLVPQSIRTASFANDDYILVLQRWDLWSVLPRINPTTAAIYEDYDLTYSGFSTHPPPLAYIYINGIRNHLAAYIETDTLAITATVSVTKWPTSSGSTLTYLWAVPVEWTDVSGDTTDTLTANAPPGNYILECVITDSIGGAFTRISYVNVHDASNNPPLLISNEPRSDTRDRVGRRMSFDLYDNRLASLADGAAVIYFEVVAWGRQQPVSSSIALAADIDSSQTTFDVVDGSLVHVNDVLKIGSEWLKVTTVATNTLTVVRGFGGTTPATHLAAAPVFLIQYAYNDVPTATRQFVGWVQRVERESNEGLRQAAIDLIGPANVLALLNSTSQLIQVNASPTTWQQAVPSLMSASFMAYYMLQWRVGNLLRLFNFTPFSVNPAGQRLPVWQIDKGTILQQIQQLATDSGNFGANSEGEFFFLKLPQMIPYADRGDVVIRDSLEASIYNTVTVTEVRTNVVSQVRGEAFSWDGSAVLPISYYSDAPKSPGQGGSQIKLLSQVVADQTSDNELTHNWYANKNNPYPSVVTTINSNWDVIEPAELPFVEVSIPAYLDPAAESSDGTTTWQHNVIPLTVNKKHNPDGTADMEMTGEAETAGFGAVAISVPAANTSIFTSPYTPQPPDPPQPPNLGDWTIPIPGGVPPTTPASGAPTVVPGLGAIRNSSTVAYRTYDIIVATPVWDAVTPPNALATIVMLIMDKGTDFSRGAYCLSTDGTDSVVSYTDDVFETVPVWTDSVNPGIGYYICSTRGVPGEVYVALNGSAPSGCADIWEVVNGTETSRTSDTITADAVLISGHYHITIEDNSLAVPPVDTVCRYINVVINSGHVTTTGWWPCGSPTEVIGLFNNSTCVWALDMVDTSPFSITFGLSADAMCGTCTTPAGEAFSVLSHDFGSTWDDPQPFGTILTPSGFDVGRKGLVSYAGDTEQVVNAFGGAYSTESRGGTGLTGTYPIAIKIPDLRNGSSSLTNISGAASYLFQTADFVSGEAWFKVLKIRVPMTPSVGGVKAVGVSPLGIDAWRGKTFMGIGDVDDGGIIRYVFVSRSTGAGWNHTAKSGAVAVRARRLSQLGNQWILSRGGSGCEYTQDWGATWTSKSSDETLYAEIFG